jgi:hypothetical protein
MHGMDYLQISGHDSLIQQIGRYYKLLRSVRDIMSSIGKRMPQVAKASG